MKKPQETLARTPVRSAPPKAAPPKAARPSFEAETAAALEPAPAPKPSARVKQKVLETKTPPQKAKVEEPSSPAAAPAKDDAAAGIAGAWAPFFRRVEERLHDDRRELLKEIRSLREIVVSARAPSPPPAGPALEGDVEAMRRLLSEVLERQVESLIAEVCSIRSALASGADRESLLEQVDGLLTDMGAIPFQAEHLEHLDPLIHSVVAERTAAELPENRVLEVVRPGFRTARGTIAAKAAVVVSRRS